ncbi:MAG: hypothetical protein WC375_08640 [Methanomassiliicoccales archaeon]|jgi:hypothetical protein
MRNTKKNLKFEMAPVKKIDHLEKYINMLLDVLGWKPANCMVTDESIVADFLPFCFSNNKKVKSNIEIDKIKKLANVEAKLGVKCNLSDLVIDVARQIQTLAEQSNEK